MRTKPIGTLDHIGIAVRNIDEARKFFEGILGTRFDHGADNEAAGYRLIVLELSGLKVELLEPLGDGSFLHKFLERRGEGFHHLTFNVPDSKDKAAELKANGVRVVDETAWSDTSYEAFISPRSAHGVLIQIGSGFPTLSGRPQGSKV